MATHLRSKRISIAAAALTVALAAPFTSVVSPLPVAQAQVVATSATDFDETYSVNIVGGLDATGDVEGLKLQPGDTIAPDYDRYWWLTRPIATYQWGISASDDGTITVKRPFDALKWSRIREAGSDEIPVKVTPANGEPYATMLKLKVTETEPEAEPEPTTEATTEPTTEPTTTEATTEPTTENSEPTTEPTTTEPEPTTTAGPAEAPADEPTTTATTEPTSAEATTATSEETTPETTTPETTTTVAPTTTQTVPEETSPSETAEAPKFDLDKRYDAENFWGKDTVTVTSGKLNAGDKISSTYWSPLHRWGVAVESDGTLKISRPTSAISFNNAKNAGFATIPVTITPKNGKPYSGDLKINIVDDMPPAAWEPALPDFSKTYTVDFEKQRNKIVPGITLPEGVKVERSGLSNPGWTFSNINGQLQVNAPATFTPGVFELPVKITDGTSTVERTIKVNASNPQTTGGDIASGIGGVLGPVLGGLLGGATGGSGGIGGALGNLLGGLLGGSGSGSGEGGGGLLDKLQGALKGLVNITVEDGAVRIENNGNNNGNVTITDNAKVENNGNNSGNNNGNPVITNNANPNVVVTGNANPSVVITDNAKVENNGNNSGNNNGNPNVVVTGNANPTIKDNLSNNGNNNGNPVITNNANPNVVVTGNANPTIKDNLSNNGNNNGNPVITNNANPSVVITDNAKVENNANNSGNNNGNPVITNNANPTVNGIPLSSGGGSSKKDQGKNDQQANGGSSNLDATVGTEGGSSDPRCIATLVGLGVPLLTLIPLALASQMNVPGLPVEGVNNAVRDAARNLGMDPAALTAIGGGIAGVALTLLAVAGIRSCVPEVKEIKVGSSQQPAQLTTVAPVVSTPAAARS